MKKLMSNAVIILLLSFILSCAVKPHLIDPTFVYPSIKSEGIAILPVAGEGVDRGTRKAIGFAFKNELSEKYPDGINKK